MINSATVFRWKWMFDGLEVSEVEVAIARGEELAAQKLLPEAMLDAPC